MDQHQQNLNAKNKRMGLIVLFAVFAMTGLAFASVPLYRLFCSVTGFGGTTQNIKISAEDQPDIIKDRLIRVQFNTDISPKLPWDFVPEIKQVEIHPGQQTLVAYHAKNKSDKPITGTAIYNVTPERAGKYFFKTQCFCFDRQTLQPNEDMTMPVSFFIDPDIVKDQDLDDVKIITLSYTFFVSDTQELEKAREGFYNQHE